MVQKRKTTAAKRKTAASTKKGHKIKGHNLKKVRGGLVSDLAFNNRSANNRTF